MFSIRYNKDNFDIRTQFIKLCGFLQRKKVIILEDKPYLSKIILEQSVVKGSFIESLIALPAWKPIRSIESIDNEEWIKLSRIFKVIIKNITTRNNIRRNYKINTSK